MKSFFKDIFEYHYTINNTIIKQIKINATNFSEKSKLLLSHSLNAHQIWNSRILSEKNEFGVFEIHKLDKLSEINLSNFELSLRIIDQKKLEDTIKYSNTKGTKFENSIQEILFHISNHYSHHRGQVISELKKAGIAPIKSDYIVYKR
jgi:uncharacterized damage-inducible protein DinB